jgi:PAS domain S-box-containing protein
MSEETNPTLPAFTPEQQLRKFQQVVEQSPSQVVITDVNANIDYVNPKFTKLTGFSREELYGRNIRVLKGDQPPGLYQILWQNLLAGREWRGRFHNKKKNGELYWAAASIAPLRDADGRTLFYIMVAEDITKEVELEKLRDDLTHMIVHDLKNPLSGVVASVELFLSGTLGSLTADQRKFIENIQASGKKLTNLIMDMLDVNKLESNQLVLQRSNFTAAELLNNLNWLEANAQRDEKKVIFSGDPGLRINADLKLITRVLENLASNALKHTPRGGRVTVGLKKSGMEIIGEVSDNGEGIPAEYLDKVFDKFFKVSGQNLGTKLDTGLGLTFCKMAIEAHGGKIGVESTVGKGSRFYFTIPNQ